VNRFNDLFRIWQHEHGLRILAKDTQIKEASTLGTRSHPTLIMFHGLRNAAVWVREHTRTRTPRSKGSENRGAGDRREGLKRTVSETDVRMQAKVITLSLPESLVERLEGGQVLDHGLGSAERDSMVSLPTALIERLEVLGLEGKAREGYVEGFMMVDGGRAGNKGEESERADTAEKKSETGDAPEWENLSGKRFVTEEGPASAERR
jgi:hypothetical protein